MGKVYIFYNVCDINQQLDYCLFSCSWHAPDRPIIYDWLCHIPLFVLHYRCQAFWLVSTPTLAIHGPLRWPIKWAWIACNCRGPPSEIGCGDKMNRKYILYYYNYSAVFMQSFLLLITTVNNQQKALINYSLMLEEEKCVLIFLLLLLSVKNNYKNTESKGN